MRTTLLMLVALSLVCACDPDTPPDLDGHWRWVRSSGGLDGHGGGATCPDLVIVGTTLTHDGGSTLTYAWSRRQTIDAPEPRWTLVDPHGWVLVPTLVGDELTLSMDVFDSISSHYERQVDSRDQKAHDR